MSKVAPIQGNFSGGEFSPFMFGRMDSDRYKVGLAYVRNMIPTIQGPATRRGGTKYVGNVKDSAQKTRLIPFQYSVTQTYIIEIGDFYFRIYTNYGQVEVSPGVPVEGFLPYPVADIGAIKFTQSDDVLYLVHPKYPAIKLLRYSNTHWESQFINFRDGPYLKIREMPYAPSASVQNYFTSLAISPGGTTGNIHLSGNATAAVAVTGTANNGAGLIRIQHAAAKAYETGDQVHVKFVTGTVEANGDWTVTVIDDTHFDLQGSAFVNAYAGGGTTLPRFFRPEDVAFGFPARLIRLRFGGTWTWVQLTSYIDGVNAQAQVMGADLVNTVVGDSNFRFGLWTGPNNFSGGPLVSSSGYPSCVVFHENRLLFAGTTSAPMRIDGSNSGDYENFGPSQPDGTITDSNAYSFPLVSNDVNSIRWITSDEHGLPVGTNGAEWIVRPSILNEALTATNVMARKLSNFGSADVQPIVAGNSTIYIQRTLKKIRELSYFYDINGFKSIDTTILAEHIASDGIGAELAHQKGPQPIVWTARNDGTLIGMTFDRDLSTLKAGWHRHELGGFGDAAGDIPVVESVAVIPSPDGKQDDLWMIVKRFINGATVRSVEYMTRIFEGFDLQENAYFLDCGSTYDAPITITGISKANPAHVLCATGGIANGDKIVFRGIKGMTELNYKKFKVANKSGGGFDIHDFDGNPVDSTTFNTYVSGGTVRKLVTTISGLTWLEGETVGVFADGAPQNNKVVTGGVITLDDPAGTVHVGYNFVSDLQLLRIDAGSTNGTSIGKLRRTNKIALMLYRTLGIKIGTDPNKLDDVSFPTANDQYGLASPLFSGIKNNIPMPATSDTENQIWLRQDTPLPFTLQAVMPQMKVEDEI